MEQRGLKQDELPDCVSPSRISDLLNGKRAIRKDFAK